jgi:hypothetical protein
MDEDLDVEQFQDLGDVGKTLRTVDEVGGEGVSPLLPDGAGDHTAAIEEIREIVDEHYGDSLDELSGDDEKLVIERLVLPSDCVPHIEYRIVDSRDE